MKQPAKSANATFCATLGDQMAVDGLTHAFIAPGSRSTPLALALAAHPAITVELFHDERAAAFAALGHGLAAGRPGLVLCTSGTAAAHFYAAVIEADLSAVPLIVCTADRPPELWGRGAPQTIDQTHLYGPRVRDFVEPGPPDELDPGEWRMIARRIWSAAVGAGTGHAPGPVHANLSFRDPLTGSPDTLPLSIPALPPPAGPTIDGAQLTDIRRQLAGRRGVIIAGRCQSDPSAILALAARLGWPVIADHRSGCRSPHERRVLRHFDSLFRDATFAETHRPEVVLRIGEIVSSKATSQWLSGLDADVVASRPHGRYIDPENIASLVFDEAGMIDALLELDWPERPAGGWLDTWVTADSIAVRVIDAELDARPASEIAAARAAIAAVPAGGALVVSSSMPVRDVEWFGQHRNDLTVISNRGANGIDGVVATAIGVAGSGLPTVCLIGDVALLHDSTSLIALHNRAVDLTVMVIDNDGGGIFSFLPQHALLEPDRYELLFGTPHGTDLAALARAHGLTHQIWPGADPTPNGARILVVPSERQANLDLHERLHERVAVALAHARER